MAIVLTRIVLCVMLIAAVFAVIHRSIRHRRLIKRARSGRCERCGYILAGLTSAVCPECANAVGTAQTKFRRKSSQRLLATAGIGLIVSVLSSATLYYLSDWPSRVPTAVLLRVAPIGHTPCEQPFLEDMRRDLLDRIDTKKIPRKDLMILLERQLHDCPQVLETRRRWPRDTPLRARVFMPKFVPAGIRFGTKLDFDHCPRTIERNDSNGTFFFSNRDASWKDSTCIIRGDCIENGVICGTAHVGPFANVYWYLSPSSEPDSSPFVYASGGPGRFVPFATREFELNVEFVESVHDVLDPIVEGKVDRIMRNDVSFDIWPDGNSMDMHLAFKVRQPDDVAIGLRIEIVAEGTKVAVARGLCDDPQAKKDKFGNWPTYSFHLKGNTTLLKSLRERPEDCTVRIQGDAEMALRDFGNDTYWAGEFTRSLSSLRWAQRREE